MSVMPGSVPASDEQMARLAEAHRAYVRAAPVTPAPPLEVTVNVGHGLALAPIALDSPTVLLGAFLSLAHDLMPALLARVRADAGTMADLRLRLAQAESERNEAVLMRASAEDEHARVRADLITAVREEAATDAEIEELRSKLAHAEEEREAARAVCADLAVGVAAGRRAAEACKEVSDALLKIGARCEMREDEYPLKAVERVIVERDQAREGLEHTDALLQGARKACDDLRAERDAAVRACVEYAAEVESIAAALSGDDIDDFAASHAVVRAALDLRAERDAWMARYGDENANLDAVIANYTARLHERDAEIATLRAEREAMARVVDAARRLDTSPAGLATVQALDAALAALGQGAGAGSERDALAKGRCPWTEEELKNALSVDIGIARETGECRPLVRHVRQLIDLAALKKDGG